MIRSFTKLLRVAPGFDAANLLTMEYRVPRTKYPEGAQQWNFHKEVTERVRALPGVKSASVILALPYSGNGGTIGFVPLNGPEPPKGQEPVAQRNIADPYYFQTMQIPLISGRVFSSRIGRAGRRSRLSTKRCVRVTGPTKILWADHCVCLMTALLRGTLP